MRHNRVHRHRPNWNKHHPGREFGTIRDRATDQGGGDDRETQLESDVEQFGNRTVRGIRTYPPQPGMRQAADEPIHAAVGECQRVADKQPGHGNQRN